MNPRIGWIALALPACLCACAPHYTPIAVRNAGFEEPVQARGIPQWMALLHVDSSAYEMTVDTDVAAQGKASARIRQLHAQVYGQIAQTIVLPVHAQGRTLRLRASVRTQGASGKGLSLVLDFPGNPDDKTRASSNAVREDSDWREVSVQTPVPAGAGEVSIAAYLRGPGTAWIDEVQLELSP